MKNGLYKVHFQTSLGTGAGIVVLRDGRLLGGDSSFWFAGRYRQDENTFTASVEMKMHMNVPGLKNVLGAPEAIISLSGAIFGDEAHMTGISPDAPRVQLRATLQFQSWPRSSAQDSAKAKWTAARVGPFRYSRAGRDGGRSYGKRRG